MTGALRLREKLAEPGILRYQQVAQQREDRTAELKLAVANLPDRPGSGAPFKHLVDVVVPTYNNADRLIPFITSLFEHTDDPGDLFHVTVVDNGWDSYVTRVLKPNPKITVLGAGGKNLGWEGGIALACKHCSAPILGMMNDDLHVIPGNPGWLKELADTFFKYKKVGAVGPCSNMVMQRQNVFYLGMDPKPYFTSLLIGFCMLVRRDLYEAIGGLTQGLPGGDDLDLSIRITQAGYRLMMRRDVFVYHHGCTTGARLFGGYWNSVEMQGLTRTTLIRRHGLAAYLRCINAMIDEPKAEDGLDRILL